MTFNRNVLICILGKVRIFIRIRPFSKQELEKRCHESVFKDGKISVLVKGPNSKKNYDYDKVSVECATFIFF